MTAPAKTWTAADFDRMVQDIVVINHSQQAVMNTIARRCRQPGCRHSAGWLVRISPREARPLCTRDASRRIRRRALPRRWAR